jgi:cytochrome c2
MERRKFTREFKLEAVRLIKDRGVSYVQASQAAREDFRYSNPMKRANLVWDENNLRKYIQDPQAKVKGNRMPYGGLADGKDVDDIIAYLKTLQ